MPVIVGHTDGARADDAALAIVSLIEGALLLSRVAGNPAALHAAKAAAGSLLAC